MLRTCLALLAFLFTSALSHASCDVDLELDWNLPAEDEGEPASLPENSFEINWQVEGVHEIGRREIAVNDAQIEMLGWPSSLHRTVDLSTSSQTLLPDELSDDRQSLVDQLWPRTKHYLRPMPAAPAKYNLSIKSIR